MVQETSEEDLSHAPKDDRGYDFSQSLAKLKVDSEQDRVNVESLMWFEVAPVKSKYSIDTGSSAEQVLDPEELVRYMSASINEVTAASGIPATTTRILMSHFKWDKQKLLDNFLYVDHDRFFAKAGVINPFRELEATIGETKECGICCCDTSPLTGLECGHRFCNECWCVYLTNKITEEGVAQTIDCPAAGCAIFVDDATVTSFVKDPQVKSKYQRLITNSFVASNRLLRWCPAANCSNAIRMQHDDTVQRVTCKCRRVFCFACGENWHDPIKCSLLKKWTKLHVADRQTLEWARTKDAKNCPKCDVIIEKHGGCCHMKCKNPSCNHDFCWVCLEPWRQQHDCNDDVSANNGREAESSQKMSFYFKNYMEHMDWLKRHHELYAVVEKKMDKMMQQPKTGWIDVQFWEEAVDILRQCHQTLMYTYAFAFYLRENSQSLIFEENQRDLEGAVKMLRVYLEGNVTPDICDTIRQKVQDTSAYCKGRRKVLLDHVHEGYDNNSWEYQNIE